MQTRQTSQGNKWLGLIMIAVAVIIALLGVTTTAGRFHGSMHDGPWELRRHGGYGGHMTGSAGNRAIGRGSMGRQWMGHQGMGHQWMAHQGMGNGFMGPGGMMHHVYMPGWIEYADDLDLSDQQNERVETIREQARDDQWELSRRMREEQWKLMTLFRADSPDPAEIGKQYARMSDLNRQNLDISVDAQRRIEALLTQEQRDVLRDRRRAWMMNWGEF